MGMRSYFREEPSGQEGERVTRLELSDDGRFVYSTEWCTWAWNIRKDAKGRWEQRGSELTLHIEESEIDGLAPPLVLRAILRAELCEFSPDDCLTQLEPRDDPFQRREAELEEEKFQRSLRIRPSKLVD
jgi:hypothetical protein